MFQVYKNVFMFEYVTKQISISIGIKEDTNGAPADFDEIKAVTIFDANHPSSSISHPSCILSVSSFFLLLPAPKEILSRL